MLKGVAIPGYQPQLGHALQTQAVIPPGTAVDGATIETTPYTAQTAALESTRTNTTGETDVREYEHQKAAEGEACVIASMCVEPEEAINGETKQPCTCNRTQCKREWFDCGKKGEGRANMLTGFYRKIQRHGQFKPRQWATV